MRIKTFIAWGSALAASLMTAAAHAEGQVTLTSAPVRAGACADGATIDAKMALADCEARAGRTASAHAALEDAARMAKSAKDPRRADLEKQRDVIESHLSKMIIVLDAPAHAAGLVITRDGAPIDPSEIGLWVAVDPGEHTVRVTAPAHAPWQTTVNVRAEGGMETVTVPILAGDAEPPVSHEGNGQRIVGLAVGGAGLAAIATGVVFGLASQSKRDQAASHCMPAPDSRCDDVGVDLRSAQRTDATAATASFIAGFVLVAGGAAVYLTAPRADGPRVGVTPSVGPHAQGVSLSGTF